MTVIASIFIPISLASSILGMNVQEVNATGHGIWAFVALAIGMIAVTSLVWLFCCALSKSKRNWRHILRDTRKRFWVDHRSRFKITSFKDLHIIDQMIFKKQKHRDIHAHPEDKYGNPILTGRKGYDALIDLLETRQGEYSRGLSWAKRWSYRVERWACYLGLISVKRVGIDDKDLLVEFAV